VGAAPFGFKGDDMRQAPPCLAAKRLLRTTQIRTTTYRSGHPLHTRYLNQNCWEMESQANSWERILAEGSVSMIT